jgi:hypothetical protein
LIFKLYSLLDKCQAKNKAKNKKSSKFCPRLNLVFAP